MGDNEKSLQDVAETIRTTETAGMIKEISTIHDELVVKQDKAKMHEMVFTTNFLDFFKSGEVNDGNAVLGAKWVEFAGSPEGEVDIINNEGKVIATVPPLISGIDLRNPNIEKINFDVIQKTYRLKADYLTVQGEEYLSNTLDAVGEVVKTANMFDGKHSKEWNDLFNKFDKKETTVTEDTSKKATKLTSPDDDTMDY